jgi:hypothetical protein
MQEAQPIDVHRAGLHHFRGVDLDDPLEIRIHRVTKDHLCHARSVPALSDGNAARR